MSMIHTVTKEELIRMFNSWVQYFPEGTTFQIHQVAKTTVYISANEPEY